MSTALRCALRSLSGEPVIESLVTKEGGSVQTNADLEAFEREPWSNPDNAEAEHALEREIELARLERENEELRRLAGLLPSPNYQRPRRFATDSDIDNDGEPSRDRSDIFNSGGQYGGGLGQGIFRLAGLGNSSNGDSFGH